MRFLSKTIQALIVALVTALGTSLFQQPIADFFGFMPVKADITISEWHPNVRNGVPLRTKDSDPLVELKNVLKNIEKSSFSEPDALAIIKFTNTGNKVVTGIKVNVSRRSFFEVVAKESIPSESDFVEVEKLKPGDDLVIRLWTSSFLTNKYTINKELKISSNDGMIPFSVNSSVTDQFNSDDKVFTFFDEWLPFTITIMFVILLLLLFILAAINESYYKELLSDDNFYVKEKVRFESNFDKFAISFDKLGERHKRFKARRLNKSLDESTG
jgi:hypothetical protein